MKVERVLESSYSMVLYMKDEGVFASRMRVYVKVEQAIDVFQKI